MSEPVKRIKVVGDMEGYYAKNRFPDNFTVTLPHDEYAIVGEFQNFIILGVWLGDAPSTKHWYFVDKIELDKKWKYKEVE